MKIGASEPKKRVFFAYFSKKYAKNHKIGIELSICKLYNVYTIKNQNSYKEKVL